MSDLFDNDVPRQNGRLSKELDLVSHHVRTRLDELKRQEVSRLRMLLKAKLDSTNIQSEWTTLTWLVQQRRGFLVNVFIDVWTVTRLMAEYSNC